MRIGIDASNLRGGGGLTHLAALLAHADPAEDDFERIIVWAPQATLAAIDDHPWLVKAASPEPGATLASRIEWRARLLPGFARAECDLLFAPGGLCTGSFRPVVTMSRNLLPFQWREMARYGPSKMLLRLVALRRLQQRSFRIADGVIFLSDFARQTVVRSTGPLAGQVAVIPHGVDEGFFRAPRRQCELAQYTMAKPLRLLYTSMIDVYKHQPIVAQAVAQLRREGIPVSIDFVGGAYPKAVDRLRTVMHREDSRETFLHTKGQVPHAELPGLYHAADAFVFASSCENLPNILLEAMAAGLPIACSGRGPMPEVLGDGGLYFDPLRPREVTAALRKLVQDASLRARLASNAHDRARDFSWSACTRETFRFLRNVAANSCRPRSRTLANRR
jgi:glycosyltransferase involved in cell wall biosynthesis